MQQKLGHEFEHTYVSDDAEITELSDIEGGKINILYAVGLVGGASNYRQAAIQRYCI